MSRRLPGESSSLLTPPAGADPAHHLWSLWRRGLRPKVRDFLAEAGQLMPAQVAAVLLIDQRERWQDSERIPAETYLELYPGLHADAEFVVEVAYGEFLLREELGEAPKPEDYLRRFPQYADRLRLQIGLHQAVQADQTPAPVNRAPREGMEQTEPGPGVEPSPEVDPAWPVLPGYEIFGELGRGGMGIVYRARQVELNRPVALKVIRAGEEADADQMARFRVEAEAVARLQHPHIVQIYEIGKQLRRSAGRVTECPFMALEFVEGGSLAAHLVGRPQPPQESAALVETVARAMHFAHQRGVLHRDLKPSNILLQKQGDKERGTPGDKETGRQGDKEKRGAFGPFSSSSVSSVVDAFTPKIADFGLAKVLEDGSPGQTQTGWVIGTPSYMAPEQAAGKSREIAVPADVHALGAILYEMLTGRPPFRASTSVETLDRVRSQEPLPPRRLQAGVPYDLETICLKCLQKEPGKRYASAGDLADDLCRFLNGEPIHARPASARERLVKWGKRHPTLAALWAVSSLAVLTVVVVVIVWNARLQTQRDLAEFRRRDAVENLRKAREIVDRLVTRLADSKLGDVPQMEPVQHELFEDAVKYYRDFARRSGDDPEIRLELGRAQRRLGGHYGHLGQKDLAKNALREALAIFEALTADFPTVPAYRQELALANQYMGARLSEAGKLPEAQAYFQRALDLQLQLVADYPDEPAFRTNLSNTYTGAGIIFGKMGRPQDRQDAFRKSEQVLQALVIQFPDQSGYAELLAVARQNLAGDLSESGRLQEAEEILRAIQDFWEQRLAQSPDKSNYRSKLALTYFDLGSVLRDRSQLRQAEEAFRRAIDLRQKLADDFPRAPYSHAALAAVLDSLAGVLSQRGEFAEAQRLLEQSIRQQRMRWEIEPNNPEALKKLSEAHFALVETLLRRHDHTTAARAATELSSLAPANPQQQVQAASLLARCATLVESDTTLPATKRRESAQQYAVRAVELLRKAVSSGLRTREAVDKDPSFNILRSRTDYQELHQRMTKRE